MDALEDSPAPRYLPIDRNQIRLHPLDVERLIDSDHPARKIWRVVSQLDLSGFEADARAVAGRAGRPGHSPHLLVSIWISAYSKGLHSAREIARQAEYEPGWQWLTALRPVNHHCLSDFRVQHGEALRELFEQVLAMLTKNKLITFERVAVDGTKIRADVNRKSFSKAANLRKHLKPAIERFDEKMQRAEAQAIYKRRAPLAEFPNAWIKTKLKLRRFATRGLRKVQCEATWAALTFNLQRMFRLAPELA